MEEKDFALRLATLRTKKGVSARDMSLSIGQNPGYINNIESNKNTISFKFKYLEETLKLFRRKRINYIVIDSDINYQIYDYYFTEYNNYIRYLNFGKIFNRFKKKHIKVYSLPENKYEC